MGEEKNSAAETASVCARVDEFWRLISTACHRQTS